jgi:hypothetical protein
MKKATYLIFLLFFAAALHAQSAKEVDSIVRLYPKNFSSPDQLAQRIRTDFTTDFGKARAIYSWLAFNVSYDVKSYLHPKPAKPITYKTEEERLRKVKQHYDEMLAKVLHKRKAVCQGYSELFNYVAIEVGLESQINSGDAKTRVYDIGRRRVRVNHAWNSVKIDGEWRLIDATWGAGYVDIEKEKFYRRFNSLYFDTPPKLFFKEHYPANGKWFDTEVDKTEFLKAPLINEDILNGKYQILEPKNGIIEVCKNESVTFKIANISPDSIIEYSLKRQDELGEVYTTIQKDNAVEFEIMIDRDIPRYMTLYVDGDPIATFKVSLYKS